MVKNQSVCLGSIAARVGCDLLLIINIMVSIVFTALTEGRGGDVEASVKNEGTEGKYKVANPVAGVRNYNIGNAVDTNKSS